MAELFGVTFVSVWAVSVGALLLGLYRLKRERAEVEADRALVKAQSIVAQNKALAIDVMLREIQLLQADLDIAHQAVEWEVLQVEQVRGRRVH